MDIIIDELAMSSSLDRDIKELSGGELQKLTVGITLMKDADISLFDEASSYLDINERLRISEIIRKLSKSKTVLVVEHDLAIHLG